jgi:hypothetical protein
MTLAPSSHPHRAPVLAQAGAPAAISADFDSPIPLL